MNNTKITFRKFPDGEIIALSPDTIADQNGNIDSYMHVGQHSAASPDLLTDLQKATKEEYTDLLEELINLVGYKNLIIIS